MTDVLPARLVLTYQPCWQQSLGARIHIGEAPGKNEVEKGEPFIGPAGYVLDAWLLRAVPQLQIAKERGEVTVMNTLRCLPPESQGRAYPKGEERTWVRSSWLIISTLSLIITLPEAKRLR